MKKLTVQIPDLTCASCVPRIEAVMRQQEGVIWAIVNFAAGEATITYDPLDFCLAAFAQAIRRIGYQVTVNGAPVVRTQKRSMKPYRLYRVQHWVRILHR